MEKSVKLAKPQELAASLIALLVMLFAVCGNLPLKGPIKKISAAVLQRNIDQNVPWDSKYKTTVIEANKNLLAKIKGGKPQLIVWPETGYPGVLKLEPAGVMAAVKMSEKNSYNLIGSDNISLDKGRRRYFNSVFLVTPDGTISGEYSKYHLVPFGEYVPMQELFPFVDKVVRRYGYEGFSRGKIIEPLSMGKVKLGALICYDSLFPEISREFVGKGAKFLTYLSYESWYGSTQASGQIFTNTALRAVENDVYLVRCVESGISGIVDNRGRIISETGLFKEEVLTGEIEVKTGDYKTFYTRFGDWFPYFLLLVMLPFIAAGIWKKQS